MNLIAMAAKLDVAVGAVAGINAHYSVHPDTIGTTPCSVILQPKGSTRTGSQQRTTVEFPIRIYVARIPSDNVAATLMNPFVNGVIAALAPINSAQTATNLWAVITKIDWDTDRYYQVGDESYVGLEFTVHMEQIEAVSNYGAV